MERVFVPEERPFTEVRHVGIALLRMDANQRHIGILHRATDEERVAFLHLAWHYRLREDESPKDDYVWIDPEVPPARARQTAAFCRKLSRNNQTGIPYAFSAPNDCFDEASARFLLGGTRYGLTCATFVVAVFRATGLQMLDDDTWKDRDGDAEWQRSIIPLLRQSGADEAHVRHVESEVGSIRFRPEDVGGAAANSPWPVDFEQATMTGAKLIELLETRHRKVQ